MRILISILLFSFSFGTILHVPAQYDSIQVAIDEALEGDTVLVAPGTYYENLIIQKSITLASRAILDQVNGHLESWVGFDDEYYVINENINATILDGSLDTNGDGLESVILIDSPSDECIEPLIFGFTITGGNGTVVMVEVDDREGERTEVEQIRGGGFLSRNALPKFKYNAIINNKGSGDDKVYSGGGGEESNGDQIRMRETRAGYSWGDSRTECEGDLNLSFNLYRDNEALYGSTFSTLEFVGTIDMTNSIFDVYADSLEDVSEYWINTEADYDASGGDGTEDAIVENVWVSPNGDDLNSGLTADEAFLTINRAFEMIFPTESNPITIYFTEGTFSPDSSGEFFPIIMLSNVNLIGQGPGLTILDAEQSGRVMTFNYTYNVNIANLTITGGLANGDDYYETVGGGILLYYAIASLNRLAIVSNTAANTAGGFYARNSDLDLTNMTITENEALDIGACSYCWFYSSININNSIIWDNDSFEFDELFTFVDITYSDIQGGYEGEGNIDANPLFNDAPNGDYSLLDDSPGIDAGSAEGISFYCGDGPDMGAFEFITEDCVEECADGSLMDECGICDGDGSSCLDCCAVSNGDNSTCGGSGDVNGGGLDVTDIVAMVAGILEIEIFNECQYNEADGNSDGSLNVLDILIFIDWIVNDSAPYVVDIDGNIYYTIDIGAQTWLQDNLMVTHFRNGDEIPTEYSGAEWADLTTGAYAVYNNDPANADIYGNLYNWSAVDDERGICPEGFHVVTDDEWMVLTEYLAPDDEFNNSDGENWGNYIAGGLIKETGTLESGDGYWQEPNEGATNESGLSIRPSGYRSGSSGTYTGLGSIGYYWSATAYDNNDVWYRKLNFANAKIYRVHWYWGTGGGSGMPVRCVGD